MQLITVAVATHEAGMVALGRLGDAVAEGRITVEDSALVHKDEKGRVKIHQTRDAGAAKGAFAGGGVGLLVGIVAGPAVLAATAVGAGAGAVLAKARDRGISDGLMKQVGSLIEGDEAALFVLADDASAATIAEMVEEARARGAEVEYEVIPPDAQALLREALEYGGKA